MSYRVTKTYGHDLGLSAAFRQWRADSHCKYIHGYALSFKLTFEGDTLDERNWLVDFGGLKIVKQFLVENFDHILVVAKDDPELGLYSMMADAGLADVRVLDNVGCEAFAKFVYDEVSAIIHMKLGGRVRLTEVEVREHGANSASYVAE